MCLLTIIILITVLGLVSSTPISELGKRQSEGGSIMVVAPSENISPQAAQIASSLNGQVRSIPLSPQNLTLVSL